MTVAIMQGRLLPPTDGRIQCFPRDRWRDEFVLARAAELDAIEWIFDDFGRDVNPIVTDSGLQEMAALSAQTGIGLRSVCADYFMEKPLVRATDDEIDDRIETLAWLLRRCALLGAKRVVVPFVDASRIDSGAELAAVAAILGRVTPVLDETGVELHLETALAPEPFADLLDRTPHSSVKVNYDSGNSASLGYRPRDEFDAYGPRVGSVHIKDRVLGGATVPLGTGDTDFDGLFESLADVAYEGDFVLQVARGVDGDEVSWALQNRSFLRTLQAARV
jgi:L-ribulose-5-phosphate 3-epimerase